MIRPCNIVMDVPDVQAAANFYERLLGWQRTAEIAEIDYIQIDGMDGRVSLGFQLDEDYRPPNWPDSAGNGQMLHIDFEVDDVEREKARALALGAALPERQYMPPEEGVTLLDPFGHPFDLVRAWFGH